MIAQVVEKANHADSHSICDFDGRPIAVLACIIGKLTQVCHKRRQPVYRYAKHEHQGNNIKPSVIDNCGSGRRQSRVTPSIRR